MCYGTCPQGYYSSQLACVACMSNCLACSDYSSCTSCQSGYSLFGGQCLYHCPVGTYASLNATSGQT